MVVFMTAEAQSSQSIACATITAHSYSICLIKIFASPRTHLELASITIEAHITRASLFVVLLVSLCEDAPSIYFACADDTIVARAAFGEILEVECPQQ
jgi:hypothetical protein